MILRFATIYVFLITTSVQAQSQCIFKNYNDTLILNDEAVGVIFESDDVLNAAFIDKKSLKQFKKCKVDFDIVELTVDEFVLEPKLIVDFQSKTIKSSLGELIARFDQNYNSENYCVLEISLEVPPSSVDRAFIRYCLQNNPSFDKKCRFWFLSESEIWIREQRRSDLDEKRLKAEAEKNRIERFYATLTERLSQELDPIEGVYKSIDQGESFEYDIAILKSLSNEREYISLVLESTDPSFTIGSGVFTFTKTAGPSVYFVSYQNKAGQQFENKTATFDGVLLSMGVKSFVKMYPSENESRKYNEINPLFDWESSGSGALINKGGYIVTNNHVVTGANKIRIAFQNDSIDYDAVIISQNEAADVAVLQIVDDRFKSEITPVSWSTDFNLGQKVFTLGYPISNKMSNNVKVVDGIVSGETGVGGNPMYFQTTLPVWYGNSGGPCFNSKGEIVGLATQILWDRGEKVDNVAYITKTENIFNLGKEIIIKGESDGEEKNLEQLIEQLIPYSVFIKVNY